MICIIMRYVIYHCGRAVLQPESTELTILSVAFNLSYIDVPSHAFKNIMLGPVSLNVWGFSMFRDKVREGASTLS